MYYCDHDNNIKEPLRGKSILRFAQLIKEILIKNGHKDIENKTRRKTNKTAPKQEFIFPGGAPEFAQDHTDIDVLPGFHIYKHKTNYNKLAFLDRINYGRGGI